MTTSRRVPPTWPQRLQQAIDRRLRLWGVPRWLRAVIFIMLALLLFAALFIGTALLLLVLWTWSVPDLRAAWASGTLSFRLACKLVVLIAIGRIMLSGTTFLTLPIAGAEDS